MKTILINSIIKETAKAILVSVPVSWAGNMHAKEIWFPKSVVESQTEKRMAVKGWFIDKQEVANEYHGYRMYFEEL